MSDAESVRRATLGPRSRDRAPTRRGGAPEVCDPVARTILVGGRGPKVASFLVPKVAISRQTATYWFFPRLLTSVELVNCRTHRARMKDRLSRSPKLNAQSPFSQTIQLRRTVTVLIKYLEASLINSCKVIFGEE